MCYPERLEETIEVSMQCRVVNKRGGYSRVRTFVPFPSLLLLPKLGAAIVCTGTEVIICERWWYERIRTAD